MRMLEGRIRKALALLAVRTPLKEAQKAGRKRPGMEKGKSG